MIRALFGKCDGILKFILSLVLEIKFYLENFFPEPRLRYTFRAIGCGGDFFLKILWGLNYGSDWKSESGKVCGKIVSYTRKL